MTLRERFAAWKLRRRWPDRELLYQLRIALQQDAQWLSHDPVASALIQRYQDMAACDWYRRRSQHVSDFRRDIGLEPDYAGQMRIADPQVIFERSQKLERDGDLRGISGLLPEHGWD